MSTEEIAFCVLAAILTTLLVRSIVLSLLERD